MRWSTAHKHKKAKAAGWLRGYLAFRARRDQYWVDVEIIRRTYLSSGPDAAIAAAATTKTFAPIR